MTKPATRPLKPKHTPPFLDPNQEPEGPEEHERQGEGEAAGKGRLRQLQEKRAKAGLLPGQLDTTTAEILHRQKELKSRRMYLQNFWYAAGASLRPPKPPNCY